MRLSSALLAVGVVPAALALPVVTAAPAKAAPVAPKVFSVALSGVYTHGLQSVRGRKTPVLLTPQTRTKRFDLVAVTWAAGSAPSGSTVQVRVREHGAWSGWETLESDQDGPDAGSADATAQAAAQRDGSESLLVDAADALQVRVDGTRAPRAVRAELVDGGRSKADAQLPTLGARRASSTASADLAAPTIVTRAQWGADESIRGHDPSYTGTPNVGFIHHTASSNNYSPADAAAQVRAIYAYHVKYNHWSDIGYNYLVDQYGTIYEGRAGGIDKNVLGAHTGGFNSNSFAISELGDFGKMAAPDAMVESISQLMAWRLSIAHRDPNAIAHKVSAGGGTSRYKAGVGVDIPVISAHRDVGATECPGEYLYARMPDIRARVTALMGPSIFDPTLSPHTVPLAADGRAADGTVTLAAHTSDPQAWTMQVLDPTGAVVASQTGATTPDNLTIAAAWNRRVGALLAPPGAYAVTLSSTSGAGAVRSFTDVVTVASPAPVAPVPAPPVAAPAAPAAPVLPDPPAIAVIYTSNGERTRGGRAWSTACIDYQRTHRCAASAMSSTYVRSATTKKITHVVGMMLTGYGYTTPYTPAWDTNPYAAEGVKKLGARSWKVDCNVPSGPRICNVYAQTTVWSRVVRKGKVGFRQAPVWKLNRVYRLFVTK